MNERLLRTLHRLLSGFAPVNLCGSLTRGEGAADNTAGSFAHSGRGFRLFETQTPTDERLFEKILGDGELVVPLSDCGREQIEFRVNC